MINCYVLISQEIFMGKFMILSSSSTNGEVIWKLEGTFFEVRHGAALLRHIFPAARPEATSSSNGFYCICVDLDQRLN
jgi:hypothetical protein